MRRERIFYISGLKLLAVCIIFGACTNSKNEKDEKHYNGIAGQPKGTTAINTTQNDTPMINTISSFTTRGEEAHSAFHLGLLLMHQANYDNARRYFFKAMSIYENLDDKKNVARCADKLGDIYTALGNVEEAKKQYTYSLSFNEKLEDNEGVANSYTLLGNLANKTNNSTRALEYFQRSLTIHTNADDNVGLAKDYNNIGLVLYDQKDFTYALEHFNKALEYARTSGNVRGMADAYDNIAKIHEAEGNIDEALQYYSKASKLYIDLNDEQSIASSYNHIGTIKKDQGKYKDALDYYFNSMSLAKAVGAKNVIQQVTRNLSRTYAIMKDYKSAYIYYNQYTALKDSMEHHPQQPHLAETDTVTAPEEIKPVAHKQTAETHQEIQENHSTAETQATEQHLQEAEKENKNLKREAFAIVLTLFASAGLLAVANYRQKIKNTERIAEKNKEIADKRIASLLKEQELKAMNAMMEGQEKERKRIAEDLHDRLGSMLATVKLHFSDVAFSSDCFQSTKCKGQFEKANHLLDEACKEVRRVSHDLASGILMKFGLVAALNELKQTIESGSNLKVSISSHNLDDRLENQVEVNVYRVIQELMHNIMKHAHANEVHIQLNKLDNVLTVMVEDDGVGFDRNDPSYKPGLGLQSMESRVRKIDGTFTIDSSKGNGTTAIIEIPV